DPTEVEVFLVHHYFGRSGPRNRRENAGHKDDANGKISRHVILPERMKNLLLPLNSIINGIDLANHFSSATE
ncbi:hypothetical protein, partial [Desulfuromonas sp. TF]|uniref:hypothetical protein n=1 Tax=Desulfuromonas sp. TF TaxID=1232410 RepID=UPI001D03D814